MFEKFHSYSFLQILQSEMQKPEEEDPQFLSPITIHEKQWLVEALKLEQASLFLNDEEKEKISEILANGFTDHNQKEYIIEKGRMVLEKELPIVKENIAILSQTIIHRQAVQCDLLEMNGRRKGIRILPKKMEYSMKTAQWSLSGLELNSNQLINIQLDKINELRPFTISGEQFETYSSSFFRILEERREKAVIILNRDVFKEHPIEDEKLRILNSFSSFDKEVKVDKEDPLFYEIIVYYYPQEFQHLLSVIVLLGHRIEVISPPSLRKEIKEIARKSYERY